MAAATQVVPDDDRGVRRSRVGEFAFGLLRSSAFTIFLIDVLLVILFTLLSPNNRFGSLLNFQSLMYYSMVALLLALGMTLVVAAEMAQLRILREIHGVEFARARLAFGYSLGEMAAVCVTGAVAAEDLVRVPLSMARECAELGYNVKLAVLFSRGKAIPESHVHRLCVKVSSAGRG